MVRTASLLGILVSLSIFASAQTPAAPTEGLASVSFTLDFPGSEPEHYKFRVLSDGSAQYESSGRISADSDASDSFDFDFRVSPETRAKIFLLAGKANYFQKDIDSNHKGMAFTGKKTLAYKDLQRTGEATYNFSSNPAAQELTALFQNLSATLEFGHRLDYDHRYQKLALDGELKRMQEMTETKMLVEVAVIQPILQQIVADRSVINVTRARAQRLIDGEHGQ